MPFTYNEKPWVEHNVCNCKKAEYQNQALEYPWKINSNSEQTLPNLKALSFVPSQVQCNLQWNLGSKPIILSSKSGQASVEDYFSFLFNVDRNT